MKHEMTIGLNHQNHVDKIDRNYAVKEIGKALQCCTIFDAEGFWNGEREHTLRVEVYSDENDVERLRRVAAELCRVLHQDCIIVDSEFISAK